MLILWCAKFLVWSVIAFIIILGGLGFLGLLGLILRVIDIIRGK